MKVIRVIGSMTGRKLMRSGQKGPLGKKATSRYQNQDIHQTIHLPKPMKMKMKMKRCRMMTEVMIILTINGICTGLSENALWSYDRFAG